MYVYTLIIYTLILSVVCIQYCIGYTTKSQFLNLICSRKVFEEQFVQKLNWSYSYTCILSCVCCLGDVWLTDHTAFSRNGCWLKIQRFVWETSHFLPWATCSRTELFKMGGARDLRSDCISFSCAVSSADILIPCNTITPLILVIIYQ